MSIEQEHQRRPLFTRDDVESIATGMGLRFVYVTGSNAISQAIATLDPDDVYLMVPEHTQRTGISHMMHSLCSAGWNTRSRGAIYIYLFHLRVCSQQISQTGAHLQAQLVLKNLLHRALWCPLSCKMWLLHRAQTSLFDRQMYRFTAIILAWKRYLTVKK